MPRVADVDAVIRTGRAAVDSIARAETSGARRVDHQERAPHRRVDHGAVLRDAVEIQRGAAPPIVDAELPGDDASHRVTEHADARGIEACGELRRDAAGPQA